MARPRRKKQFVYTYRKVRRAAKKDGREWHWKFWPLREAKDPKPAADDTVSAYQWEIKEAAEDDLSEFGRQWEHEDTDLKREYREALVDRELARDSFSFLPLFPSY